jgi:hypothetical protein
MTPTKRAEGRTYTFSSGVDQERAGLMAEEIAKGKVEEFAERVIADLATRPMDLLSRQTAIKAIRELMKEELK